MLSYAPADGLDPAEYSPTSDISYLSSVGSSAVNTILLTPFSLTNPLEETGTLNISKSRASFVAKFPGLSSRSRGVGPQPTAIKEA